jgi:transcriptional regulator with XRE-family HTH domain
MNDQPVRRLGAFLQARREELGLSARQLASRAATDQTTINRIEQGLIAAPRPDKLARIAEALGLNLADVYVHAGYAVPKDLPSFKPYLRAKYGDLPTGEIEKIETYAARLAKKHGVRLDGPAPGEDEA